MIFNMKLVFLVIIAVQLMEMVEMCPINCICEESESSCTLESCRDEIALDYTDFLIIYGKLCTEQRRILNELTPNTIIVLKSDICDGIRNCR